MQLVVVVVIKHLLLNERASTSQRSRSQTNEDRRPIDDIDDFCVHDHRHTVYHILSVRFKYSISYSSISRSANNSAARFKKVCVKTSHNKTTWQSGRLT